MTPDTIRSTDTSSFTAQGQQTKGQTARESAIAKRLVEMPESYRGTYLKATRGEASPRVAIKSFCSECVCWNRAEVRACTDTACPLWKYRPFRKEAGL